MVTGQYQLQVQNGNVVLELSGELDISSVHGFHDVLHAREDEWNGHSLEVDVRNLRYLDAAWMQVLLSLQKTVNETGQAFVVRAVSPDVAKLFELCGIDGHLRWEPAAAETETAA